MKIIQQELLAWTGLPGECISSKLRLTGILFSIRSLNNSKLFFQIWSDHQSDELEIQGIMRNSGIHLYLILPLLLASCSQTMEEFTGSEGYKAIEVVKPVYVPLAPGEIQPLGWLKDQAVLARDGFVGQLDLYDPPYTDAYLDPHDPYVEEAYVDANHFAKTWIAEEIGFRAVGADEDGTGWPLEQAAYWLDGALRLGYLLNDSALINKIEKRLDIVVNGVNDGGDSFIYWLEGQNEDEFNGWAHSHMGRALVAYYHATKKTEVLTALEKVYSRYDPSGPLHQYVTNFCNTDPMLETYRFTGNDSILNNVMNALENRSVDSVINRWAEAKDYFSQHMVVAYENIRLPMLLYPWTGEKKYLDASVYQDSLMKIQGLQPYGVMAGMEHDCGKGAFRKTETCNISCHLWNDAWFMRITGNSKWGESAELAFFNAGPGPIARDYKTLSYWLWPNRIIGTENKYEAYAYPYTAGHQYTEFAFPPTLCCVANASRILPFYITHMWMKADDGLAATFYGPCDVNTTLNNQKVNISCSTDYPFRENIEITVNPDRTMKFSIYFRIPEWCEDPQVEING
ncbi:MAG: hypothetical protein GQ579_04605, partial [Bacteroidales bacterium]|nr:hypothetical protein [Bacteroidales bacterium]